MTQSRAFSLTYIRPRQENASFSTAILDKYAVNVLHQEEVQVKWWRNKGCRLFPVTFTASRAMYEKAAMRLTSSQPSTRAHITLSLAAQTQIQCNQRWDRPLLLLSLHSDPFYYPLLSSFCSSLYAFLCPLQTEGFCHLNFSFFLLGHPWTCMSTCLLICRTRSRQPITWVEKWKVNCWSASTICFLCLCEQVWVGNASFLWNWSVHVRGQ